jgi:PIN domain nuclease of toxin-antitoxin system
MKYLWDTHAIIWAMQDYASLSDQARILASKALEPAISGISLWEISLLVWRKRLKVKPTLEAWFGELLGAVDVIPITPAIAMQAYDMGEFHGDPADRLIAATAICHGLELVTKDGRLHACRKLTCVW